ncbi:hypothetical protein CTAYLR_006415 [Chrysophaeum taylorii]|uniref:Glutamine synthetase n=1 Tax=Chrysophaeum taylorii TaxID=2483200 RepID=A0AAD7U9R6_9STRA|nr:hypothetical protein CTAYLR_006415 [Chrysophaeum taylorii]
MAKGRLTMEELAEAAAAGTIDTVLACIVDLQGRLMGKRFTVSHYLASAHAESHCCKYLLATDLMMQTPDGYANTGWSSGYGDYVMRPIASTLRVAAWLEGTALVLCDVVDHDTHEIVDVSPRAVLERQIARLGELGLDARCATELEFFVFEENYDQLRKKGYAALEPISGVNEDYHILQTTKEERIMRPIRNQLVASAVPVENTKGEAETGQAELNIRYGPALDAADNHTIAKHAVKEISWQQGVSATFLAKWARDKVGSSSHVHISVWKDGQNAFYDADDDLGMSSLMKHFLAGLIAYSPEYTVLLAPYVNSYKRFMKGTFAPTKTVWSVDNRTAAFRICGARTEAVRVECRIGGADLNPYLAFAGLLAAGIKGLRSDLALQPAATGDIYELQCANTIPATLREASPRFRSSAMLREALGRSVVDHYARCAEWEQEEFDRVVSDWEIKRGFELA